MTNDDQQNLWGSRRLRTTALASSRYDIVWLGSLPVAQLNGGTIWRGTFTDHLGTPILQFDPATTVTWRAEYEPYGDLWQLRVGESRWDQPLRFPGQEVALTWEGHEENYNVFRWYRTGLGRYTQPDATGLRSDLDLYRYANSSPIMVMDRLALQGSLYVPRYPGNTPSPKGCDAGPWKYTGTDLHAYRQVSVWQLSEEREVPIGAGTMGGEGDAGAAASPGGGPVGSGSSIEGEGPHGGLACLCTYILTGKRTYYERWDNFTRYLCCAGTGSEERTRRLSGSGPQFTPDRSLPYTTKTIMTGTAGGMCKCPEEREN